MTGLSLAWRALLSDWRAGELRILALALLVAVGGVSAVGFFTDRVRLAMESQAGELLAADRVVESRGELPPEWVEQARSHGLATARIQSFRTVVVVGDDLQLVEVKAVGEGYPLRGRLRTAPRPYAADAPAEAGPAPGNVWLSARLAAQLGIEPGAEVRLGSRLFTYARVLTYEPDRGAELFSIGPRLMMNRADLPSTGLIGPGSLVTYRLLLAGDPAELARYQRWIEPHLGRGERLLGGREARPELSSALQRAERFLGLASLVSVLLAGVAAATAAHRYAARRVDGVAVMRCLGARQGFITRLYITQLSLLALVASLAGVLVGYLAQGVLAALLSELFTYTLPPPSFRPVLVGLGTGFVTLGGFALPPMLGLRRVPPMRVLRHEARPVRSTALLVYGAAITALGILMVWQARDATLAAYVFGGALATVAVLAATAAGLVVALNPLRARVRGTFTYWFGLTNIPRRAAVSSLQVVAFGLGIMVLLLLALVRGDLLAGWQQSLPADAPNQFLINIQPEQVSALKTFIAERSGTAPVFYPMVRGRLIAIDGRPVVPEQYEEPRARRLAQREFNLSYADTLAADNRIVAGRWWGEGIEGGPPQWSVEQGIADTLGIDLGDRLQFSVAGRTIEGRVTNLRSVDWDSFRVNFFVLGTPALLADQPASYITSFHLPPAQRELLADLVRAFPNVTVIDVDAIMSRVRGIIERVSLAVEFVFGFTLLAGFVVLLAAIQATHDERLRESALLRMLGATRGQVREAQAAEFLALGLLAGLLAALAASVIGYVLAEHIFHFEWRANPWLWLAGIAAGTLGVGAAGWWGTRRVLARAPLQTLRRL